MSRAEVVKHLLVYLNHNYFQRDGYQTSDDLPLFIAGDRINARYAGFSLDSLFEPIVDLASDEAVGSEALLQLQSGNGARFCKPLLVGTPAQPAATDRADIIHIDRLSRTLHALNFLIQEGGTAHYQGALHLNVHLEHLLTVSADHGRVFEEILRGCGLAPSSFVLELVEFPVRDRLHLRNAIGAWQTRGYRVAIDAFGRNHLHIGRVLALSPDLIKIDRTALDAALLSPRHRELLSYAVAAARDHGVDMIATGVDSDRLRLAIEKIGITRAQGELFGAPHAEWRHGAGAAPAGANPSQRISI